MLNEMNGGASRLAVGADPGWRATRDPEHAAASSVLTRMPASTARDQREMRQVAFIDINTSRSTGTPIRSRAQRNLQSLLRNTRQGSPCSIATTSSSSATRPVRAHRHGIADAAAEQRNGRGGPRRRSVPRVDPPRRLPRSGHGASHRPHVVSSRGHRNGSHRDRAGGGATTAAPIRCSSSHRRAPGSVVASAARSLCSPRGVT